MDKKERLEKLRNYFYDEIYETYGWLPPEAVYDDCNKIEEYKNEFIREFYYNFVNDTLNESEINERNDIILKVKEL